MVVSVVKTLPFDESEVFRMGFEIFFHRNCRHITVTAVLTVPGGGEVTVEDIIIKSVMAPDVEGNNRDTGKRVIAGECDLCAGDP